MEKKNGLLQLQLGAKSVFGAFFLLPTFLFCGSGSYCCEDEKPPSTGEMTCEEFFCPLGDDLFWSAQECMPWCIGAAMNIWRPGLSDRAIAYGNVSFSESTPIEGRTVKIPMRWRIGFSAEVGHNFFHRDWMLSLGYTYFNELATTAVGNAFLSTLMPLVSVNVHGNQVNRAEGSIRVFWNDLTFLASKNFHFSENVSLQGALGIDSSWLLLREDVVYTGGDFLAGRTSSVKELEKYWGIGPKMGVRSKWLFMGSFYFRGDLLMALEYGIFNLLYLEKLSATPSASIQIRERETGLVPMLDLGLGVGIADYLCDKKYFATFDLSYETRFMWRQNEWILVDPLSSPRYSLSNSDLSFQGFTIKFGLSF